MSENYFQDRMAFLRRKYKIDDGRLALVSDRPKEKEVTLGDVQRYNDSADRRNGLKLKVATASTKFMVDGKPMTRLYYDVKL